MNKYSVKLVNKSKTSLLAQHISAICIKYKVIIYLHGEIGSGKTTFSKAFIKAMGYNKIVKSPTYTIIEKYRIKNKTLLHIDLYRINHENELEILGIKEYFIKSCTCLIEWAEKGTKYIKKPDISINFSYINNHRKAKIKYSSQIGKKILHKFIKIKNIY